jgi:hypothetical protein
MVYYPHLEVLVLCRQGSNASEGARAGCWQVCSGDNKSTGIRLESNSKCKQRGRRPTAIWTAFAAFTRSSVSAGSTKTAMSQARSARSIFLFGLLSLVQADSLGQLTVCIVEAYNLENLDANEAFGGTASDP